MHFSDDDLRSALRRKHPSPDFAGQVLAKISRASQSNISRTTISRITISPNWLQHGWLRWAACAMAACLLLVLGGIVEYRYYEQEQERAKAAEQARVAFHIADEKLNLVLQRSMLERGILPQILETNSKSQKEHL